MEQEHFTATAAQLSRNFGFWQDRAAIRPVLITHHGRPRVVLMSLENMSGQREDLSAVAARGHAHFELVIERIRQGFFWFGRDFEIRMANSTACVHVGLPQNEIVGRSAYDVLPELKGSNMERVLHRVVRIGDPAAFEAPSLMHPGHTLQMEVFPFDEGLAVLFRSIDEDVEERLQLAAHAAYAAIIPALTGAAVGRLSLRATIDQADEGFARMVGFAPDQLVGRRLAEFVALRDRPVLNEAIEEVLRGGPPRCVNATLLSNRDEDVPAQVGLAPYRMEFAVEGACFLLVPQPARPASTNGRSH